MIMSKTAREQKIKIHDSNMWDFYHKLEDELPSKAKSTKHGTVKLKTLFPQPFNVTNIL